MDLSDSNTKRLTVLCCSVSAVAHVNSTLAIALALKKRNHRIVFATERSWKGEFLQYGIDEEIYDEKEYDYSFDAELNNAKKWIDFVVKSTEVLKKSPVDQIQWITKLFKQCFEMVKFAEKHLIKIVEQVKPDIIIIGNIVPYPCFIQTNIPLVYVYASNPLWVIDEDERLPPAFFGLPLDDKSEWNMCRELVNQARESLWEEINQVLKQRNLPPLRKFRLKHISTNLNIYVHPKCLMEKYLKLCPLGDEWLGLDYSLREYDKNFELSTSFKSSNRKLIYLSMGSLGSSIVELMSRLVKILSKCKHKVIVSRGTLNNMYELADNMWEQKFLPQLSILPIVDMVITHGCNQTLVESLYFGKPLIVLPFFGDQFDNAQRVVEAKIGVKFNPFTVDEKELLDSIEYMLSDAEIVKRVKCISNEMRKSKSMDYVVQKIEKIAENPKIPTVK